MTSQNSFLKNYGSSFILLGSIAVGCIIGLVFKEKAVVLKPFGDIFLNMLFTIVVPLVFFSVSSVIAGMSDMRRLRKIMGWMVIIFIVTGVIASLIMIVAVKCYPPAQGVKIAFDQPVNAEKISIGQQIVQAVTVPEFIKLFAKGNMLALILFSFLVGLATSVIGEKGRVFAEFLESGNAVMTKAISFVMLYAPIGLGAYFAYIIGDLGAQLLGSYVRVILLYYPVALGYFFIVFTFYVWLAGGVRCVKNFWANILPSALTAWGTGSGLATLPVNLETAKRLKIPEDVKDVVVCLGASVHSDGSCLAAVVKIALLFGLFNMPFSGIETILSIVAVALLCGTVISGIPSGGMLGELLIVSIFGFPIEALPVITIVGSIVDPPATMVNAVGDNVCGIMVARLMGGKNWMDAHAQV